jgi:hypothetical protein
MAAFAKSWQRVLIKRRSQRRFYGPFTSVVQKIALTAIADQATKLVPFVMKRARGASSWRAGQKNIGARRTSEADRERGNDV